MAKQDTIEEVKKLGLENLAELLESSIDNEEITDQEVVVEDAVPETNSFTELFEGVELPAGFADKAKVLFEAAVAEKAASLAESKLIALEESIKEAQEAKLQEDADQLDAYLSYVTEEWYKENQAIVESKFKVELAEGIIGKMTEILNEFNLEVTPDQDSIVESLEEQLQESNDTVDKLVMELQESKKTLARTQCERVIAEATKGMSDVEADRFITVLGEMEYVDQEDFQNKVDVLKAALIKESKVSNTVVEESVITESIDIPSSDDKNDTTTIVSETMQKYVKALKKTNFRTS